MNYFVIAHRYTAGTNCNLGDSIQSIAVEHLLQDCGVQKTAIGRLIWEELGLPSGHRGILIVQGWFGCRPGTFPLPICDEGILPLFHGFHLNEGSWEYLADNRAFLESMQKHAPIGCRDLGTRDYLRSLGIEAYYSGCLTLALPRRQAPGNPEGIYLIDPLGDIEPHLPAALRDRVVRLEQEGPLPSGKFPMSDEDIATVQSMAHQRLAEIRDRAALVVTRRIHIALPCLAMGIPVVFTFGQPENPRVSMLRQYLPIHTPNDYPTIDWNPPPPDVESEKARMVLMFRHRLQTVERSAGYPTKRLTEEEERQAAAWLDAACRQGMASPAFTATTFSPARFSRARFSRAHFIETAFTPEQLGRLAAGAPLILFGAGAAGIQLKRVLEFFGFAVDRYCDNGVADEDSRTCDGLPVIGFERLLAMPAESIVFISTLAGFAAINAQLVTAGFPAARMAGSPRLIDDFSHFVVPSKTPLGSPGHATR
ncbi:polysaccharide pyruvyl transferase family protein [Pseudothauera nasutitermitis]|uniref:Polysaccharide pyruvyl transferase family protein n=1 Tax=Pseudothauera nasutitermitis TaxID=2565930 RepID=A0A4S4B1Y7_9RHOO|nr:polysaccharide pyruvyl transferase family protein [Pseudothauera nasutitermitis]THF65687.1 polysaccharide pyruvyl transferase family protein [Pseudothauera nasutitermitis]